jgi:hypothetical protein
MMLDTSVDGAGVDGISGFASTCLPIWSKSRPGTTGRKKAVYLLWRRIVSGDVHELLKKGPIPTTCSDLDTNSDQHPDDRSEGEVIIQLHQLPALLVRRRRRNGAVAEEK